MSLAMRVALPAEISQAAVKRCDPARAIGALAGEALGTSWRVRFAERPNASPERLRAAIDDRLASIVAQMSQWEPTSLLSRFNHAPGGSWFSLPSDFATVIDAALDVAERSDGAFDPTHGRASALLGFGAVVVETPASRPALDDAHSQAGWRRLAYDREARRLRQPGGLWCDFSGIAKGFAVDAITELLRAHGLDDTLVEIGGELVGRGLKPDYQPWWVDLETPPGVPLPPFRIALHDLAVATSGDYVRGAHTLDPRTGRPLETQVISVSVIHRNAMLADAWATALTVLGPTASAALVEQECLIARFVVRAGNDIVETLSPALRQMIDRRPAFEG